MNIEIGFGDYHEARNPSSASTHRVILDVGEADSKYFYVAMVKPRFDGLLISCLLGTEQMADLGPRIRTLTLEEIYAGMLRKNGAADVAMVWDSIVDYSKKPRRKLP